MTPRLHFLDPLVEDLGLLPQVDYSLDPLGEDLSLSLFLAPALMPEAVLVVVLAWVVATAVQGLAPAAG